MINLMFTARLLSTETEEYLPAETQGLSVETNREQGDGSPEHPVQLCIRVKNMGNEVWRGLRVALTGEVWKDGMHF